jgi:hypothetical protein
MPAVNRTWATVLVVSFCATTALAQEPAVRVGPGERVRVTSESLRVDGTLMAVDDDTLTIRPRDGTADVTVPRMAIAKIERTDGRRSRVRDAGLGALIGLGVGALAGLASSTSCEPREWFCSAGFNSTFFGILGAGAGAVTGAILPPPSRWVEIDESALTEISQPIQPLPSRADRRWAIALGTGAAWGGPAVDLEEAMRRADFDDTSPAFFFPGSAHPRSNGNVGSIWLHAQYLLRPQWEVGVSYDNTTIGRTIGFHEPGQYLFVHDSVTEVNAVVSRIFGPARVGIGPAWYAARAHEDNGQSTDRSRFGVTTETGLKVPARTRLYLDVNIRYSYVGRVSVGPFTPPAPQGAASQFPETEVHFSHWFIGLGPGLRF